MYYFAEDIDIFMKTFQFPGLLDVARRTYTEIVDDSLGIECA